MHKRILVTGGAGFVGSALSVALAQALEGITVVAFDNLKRRGSERNLDTLRRSGVEFVHGDVREIADLLSVHPPPDLILECSAEPSAQAGYGGSPEYLVRTNLNGTFHCAEVARRVGADLLFISTSRVYPYGLLNQLAWRETPTRFALEVQQNIPGATGRGVSEDFPLTGPRSLYGMTKLAGELLIAEFADAYNFRFVVDRFGLLTGPGQMAKSDQGVVALWVAAHCFNRPLACIGFGGSGRQVRDFLHIDDFCELVIDQVRHFDLYAGRTWNAGGGTSNSLSLLELTALCREVTGNSPEIRSVPENRPADVRIYITDASRVRAVNGWMPKRDALATVDSIARWIRSDGPQFERLMFP